MSWKVHAVLRADIGKKRNRRVSVPTVETFSIDTALDTDADSWEIEIGDPGADLVDILDRDSECRVNLFGGHRGNLEELQMGFADEIGYTEEGTIVIRGRDITALATDTIALPRDVRHVKPELYVAKRARKLGIHDTKLAKVKPLPEFYTDGSETEWESWYRMYRKRKMWIYAEPNGRLRADLLHYSDDPTYRFGKPKHSSDRRKWISVTSCEYSSNKQQRIGEAVVIGQRSDIGMEVRVPDKSIAHWVKRPIKLFQDSDVRTRGEARQTAFEEIFESKVGAIELTITIAHPGYSIRQNKMARLRLPQMGIDDVYFVVGVQTLMTPEGAIQKIRLRQKGFAISKRVPDDPELVQPKGANILGGGLAEALGARWSDAFVGAAKEFHGPWPFDLFLAGLLAICEVESNFRNVRQGGGPEWYKRPTSGQATYHGGGAIEIWRRNFANSGGNTLNPLYPYEAGVGPMQLTSVGYKQQADRYGGKNGEYDGGRWVPEANIRAAGGALHSKLQGLTVSDANFFLGVQRYNGSGPAAVAYAKRVKNLVNNKYLSQVQSALDAAEQAGSPAEIRNAPLKIRKMLGYAEKQLGDPYVWGAEGPNSFDCSGLVYACYASVGLGGAIGGRLSTYGYWAGGKGAGGLYRVYKNDLRPGDMLFFNSLTHMGIYYKDGIMIVAPHTGDVVKKQSISVQRWYGAMRLKGLWGNDPAQGIPPHFPE